MAQTAMVDRPTLMTPSMPKLGRELPRDWGKALSASLTSQTFRDLERFVEQEYASGVNLCPPRSQVFSALKHTPIKDVKVVVIGQDPYPTLGNANGLAFSVSPGVKIPASLQNIFKGLKTNYPDWRAPSSGDLSSWARRGVLLLNTVLTVREGEPNSHRGKGWEHFTQEVLQKMNQQESRIVFLCFGLQAQKLAVTRVDTQRHALLSAPHPSPLNGGKFVEAVKQQQLFRAVNSELKAAGRGIIDWQLP
jgi:uracil-DNA glycosylase